ncbi:phage tail tape measure C-terminal domain-containing protein [Limnobacter sp.]|uniref:phage tail tape measure C-terminal domain-containing protein n=1 Tax=Limnobacter sp. TaxID=2003368 RepID=UPI002734551E|nr:phage tail tape measure C-terminal domain-containing protein [Limnobacter sp.]MDP3272797.1 phage tail tape measure C-terminal domain-containing protein [Limnobacter sp.]
MKTTSEITIEIAADLARLRTDMNQANSIVGKALGGISSAGSMAAKALGGLGVVLSAGAMVAYVRSAIDAADATSKLAQSVGLSTEEVAGLQLAYGQSGLEQTRMVESLAKLTQAAINGNEAFDALGISVRNSDGSFRTTRELLADVAERFQNMEDGTAKTALAMKLFGETGGQLIPLLNGGAEGLQYFDDAATRLGLTISDKTAKEAEKFNDTLDLMTQGAKGVSLQVAAELLPTMNDLAGSLLTAFNDSTRLANITGVLSAGMKVLASAGILVVDTLSFLTRNIGAFADAVGMVLRGDFAGAFDVVKARISEIPEEVRNAADSITSVWQPVADEGVSALTSIKGGATAVGDALSKTGEKADKLAEKIAKQAEKEWDEYFQGMLKGWEMVDKAQADFMAEGERVFQETRTPLEQYITRIEYLQKLFDGKVIDVETFTRGVEKANKDLEDFGKTGRSEIEDLEFAIQGFGKKSADAFVDFALTGKASFADLTDSILADLARLLVQQNITDPLFKAISGGVSAGGGLGGIFDSLVGSVGSFFGGGGPVEFAPTPFANGGIMTPYGPMKLNAYAGGGIVNSPQMYVAGEGRMNEAIIPLPDGRSVPVTMTGGGMGDVNVEVNVINQGQPANARVVGQRQTGNGLSIDVLIDTVDNALGARMSKGQGSLANAVPRKFGLNGAAGNAR